jgi:hypothetical protein
MAGYANSVQAFENSYLYANPGIPYVVTTSISSSAEGFEVLTASGGNYLSTVLFPDLTTFFVITNLAVTGSGENVKVGFSSAGLTGSNYFTLTPQQSISLGLRTPTIYFSGSADTSFELIAGMSNARVQNRRQFNLDGQVGIG